MKILLFSRSRVVREMVRLAAQKADAKLECVEEPAQVEGDRYDLLLVDENLSIVPDELSGHIMIARSAAIREEGTEAEGFDHILYKPFLPSDILRLLENEEEEAEEEPRLSLHGFAARDREEPQVLDGEEIARIREILEMDEEEEDPELLAELPLEDTSEAQMDRAGSLSLDARELIDLFSRCKPKKLRKALEGAEITVTIRFPSKEES